MRSIQDYDYWDLMGAAVNEEEWRTFQRELRAVEQEHLELRIALRDAEAALRDDPENEELQALVNELKQRLRELEKAAPWMSHDIPVEALLWGMPHG